MPAEAPSGRGNDAQLALGVIVSPSAPVTGLVASQLYRRLAELEVSVAL